MMRYVVRLSGSVTSAVARPCASVGSEPSQKASTRKSLRTGVPGPSSAPPPPPSSAPFGVEHAPADDALARVLGS